MTIGQMLHEGEVRKFVIAFPERSETSVENQLQQKTKPDDADQNEATARPGHGRNHTVSAVVWLLSCVRLGSEACSVDSSHRDFGGIRPGGSERDCQPVYSKLRTRLARRPHQLGLYPN